MSFSCARVEWSEASRNTQHKSSIPRVHFPSSLFFSLCGAQPQWLSAGTVPAHVFSMFLSLWNSGSCHPHLRMGVTRTYFVRCVLGVRHITYAYAAARGAHRFAQNRDAKLTEVAKSHSVTVPTVSEIVHHISPGLLGLTGLAATIGENLIEICAARDGVNSRRYNSTHRHASGLPGRFSCADCVCSKPDP